MKPDRSPEPKVYIPERMACDVPDDARSCTAGLKCVEVSLGSFPLTVACVIALRKIQDFANAFNCCPLK